MAVALSTVMIEMRRDRGDLTTHSRLPRGGQVAPGKYQPCSLLSRAVAAHVSSFKTATTVSVVDHFWVQSLF